MGLTGASCCSTLGMAMAAATAWQLSQAMLSGLRTSCQCLASSLYDYWHLDWHLQGEFSNWLPEGAQGQG